MKTMKQLLAVAVAGAMAAGTAKDEFLLKKQMIFTRRIFIGERVTLEVNE